MTHLTLSVDVGASRTKCLYAIDAEDFSYLWMEPDVTAISPAALKSHLELHKSVGQAKPYNEAWVEVRGEEDLQAVGQLASTLQAVPRLNTLKYEGALYKILAVVGSLIQDNTLPAPFSLSLTTLLPYSESSSVTLLKPELQKALKRFKFRGQSLQVELKEFVCYPEGLGLLALRGQEKGSEWLETQMIAVFMMGHRNTSLLVFERGILRTGQTTNLGFHQLVQWVADRSAGQDVGELTPTLYKTLVEKRPATLKQVVKSRQAKNAAQELKQLEEATELARQEYWRKLQDWLTETVPPQVDEVIIAGGAALCFRTEIEAYFLQTPTWWTKAPVDTLKQKFDDWNDALAFRFLDSYGSFMELRASLEEAA